MEATVVWKKNMCFKGRVGEHVVHMDATPPLGHHEGPTPKEMLALAIAANVGMDVIGILKKNKQEIESFDVDIEVKSTEEGYPIVFRDVNMTLRIEGDVDHIQAMKAVELSQTTYSGVSAMLSKAAPIRWKLLINGDEIGKGVADFEIGEDVFFTSFEG